MLVARWPPRKAPDDSPSSPPAPPPQSDVPQPWLQWGDSPFDDDDDDDSDSSSGLYPQSIYNPYHPPSDHISQRHGTVQPPAATPVYDEVCYVPNMARSTSALPTGCGYSACAKQRGPSGAAGVRVGYGRTSPGRGTGRQSRFVAIPMENYDHLLDHRMTQLPVGSRSLSRGGDTREREFARVGSKEEEEEAAAMMMMMMTSSSTSGFHNDRSRRGMSSPLSRQHSRDLGNVTSSPRQHCRDLGNFNSLSRQHSRDLGNFTSLSRQHSRDLGNATSLSRQHSRDLGNVTSLSRQHSRDLGNVTSLSRQHSRDLGNVSPLSRQHSRESNYVTSLSRQHSRDPNNVTSLSRQHSREQSNVTSLPRKHNHDLGNVRSLSRQQSRDLDNVTSSSRQQSRDLVNAVTSSRKPRYQGDDAMSLPKQRQYDAEDYNTTSSRRISREQMNDVIIQSSRQRPYQPNELSSSSQQRTRRHNDDNRQQRPTYDPNHVTGRPLEVQQLSQSDDVNDYVSVDDALPGRITMEEEEEEYEEEEAEGGLSAPLTMTTYGRADCAQAGTGAPTGVAPGDQCGALRQYEPPSGVPSSCNKDPKTTGSRGGIGERRAEKTGSWRDIFRHRKEYAALRKLALLLQDNRTASSGGGEDPGSDGSEKEAKKCVGGQGPDVEAAERDSSPVLKKILNILFLTTGIALLFAVVAVIIYTSIDDTGSDEETDPQVETASQEELSDPSGSRYPWKTVPPSPIGSYVCPADVTSPEFPDQTRKTPVAFDVVTRQPERIIPETKLIPTCQIVPVNLGQGVTLARICYRLRVVEPPPVAMATTI